jgi:enoyl-CoA hydratase/carnithine racemase
MQNERTCIQIEKKNKITTIIISRPHVKNAIDKNTAEQLIFNIKIIRNCF